MSQTASSQTSIPESQRLKRERLANERARILLGCYRRGDAIDPEIYVRSIAEILVHYEDWVIVQATHPWTGIQRTEKFKAWPPNSGELADFCEDLMKREARYAYYDTLPKPDVVWTPPAPKASRLPPPVNRDGRPSLEEMAARHADMAWAQRILKAGAAPPTLQQRLDGYNALLAQNGKPPVTQEEFEKIKDFERPLAANWQKLNP